MKRNVLIFLCIFLFVSGFLNAAEKKSVEIVVYDTIATPGEQIWLRAELSVKGLLGCRKSIVSENVVFEVKGKIIGSANTAKNGKVSILYETPGTPGIIEYMIRYKGSDKYNAAEKTGRLYLLKPDFPFLLCNMDREFTGVSPKKLMNTPLKEISPVDNSAMTLQILSNRYNIIYITNEEEYFAERLHSWMRKKAFPLHAIIYRKKGLSPLTSKSSLKKTILQLRKKFNRAPAGISDSKKDIKDFLSDGMKSVYFHTGDGIIKGAENASDWKEVYSRF
jgi:hypothetical protein